ncbi:MAG: phosphate/phosphite/phosphonate ABC transporter substrate-binding protein [Marivivens sp.]
MIASLPMYDRPEIAQETDRFWALIRASLLRQGEPAPETLTRDSRPLWQHWQDPALVLSQTCGLPYRTRLCGEVSLIATPNFGLPGCPPGYYNSVLVMRRENATERPEDWAELTLALNDFGSQSGWAAPQNFMSDLGLGFTRTVTTGAHAGSAMAVLEGTADIAAIDTQTWRLLKRHKPEVSGLTEVGFTEPTPGLPYISRANVAVEIYHRALVEALDHLTETERAALGLVSIERIPSSAYLEIPTPDLPPL